MARPVVKPLHHIVPTVNPVSDTSLLITCVLDFVGTVILFGIIAFLPVV